MALTWQAIDVREDPDEARYEHDPAERYISLAELLRRPAWHADAACREHPDVSWFPARGEPVTEAKRICAGCLVRAECEAYALEMGGWTAGIWGGTSERQRRLLRRASTSGEISKALDAA